MVTKNFSKVCSCGKGYRSRYDLRCGNCRTKHGVRRLDEFKRALIKAEREVQMQFYGMYVPDVQPADGSIDAEFPA